MKELLRFAVLALASSGLVACGDDDGGDGSGCANAQMVCASDPDAEIDCGEFDGLPASVKTCVANAASCDAVLNCLLQGTQNAPAGTGG